MKTRLQPRLKITLLLLWLVPILFIQACSEKKPEADEKQEESPVDEDILTLTRRQINTIELSYDRLKERNISYLIKATGMVDAPPMQQGLATAYVNGYVKNIYHIRGDKVKQGQALATLESPELLGMQQDLQEVNSRLPSLKSTFERQQLLYQDTISALRELQEARADYQQMKARRDALLQQLQMAGADTTAILRGEPQTRLVLRAPISGEVAGVNIKIGQRVQQDQTLFALVNTDHLHLELRVFEEHVGKVAEEQEILFVVPSLDERQRKANVYRVTSLVDEQERYAIVHGHLPEEEGLLPGMYVNAFIAISNIPLRSVSSGALTTEGDEQFLFFLTDEKEGEATFRRVKVQTGIENAGYTEIRALAVPELDTARVVVNGAYYLSNAFNQAGGHGG